MTSICISYYMATSAVCGPRALRHYCASIWHMRMRGHAITNLLHDNGMHFLEDGDVYGHGPLKMHFLGDNDIIWS